eukprot:SAG11_NODE_8209_length_1046_cov_1.612460_1_plen_55_part_00
MERCAALVVDDVQILPSLHERGEAVHAVSRGRDEGECAVHVCGEEDLRRRIACL